MAPVIPKPQHLSLECERLSSRTFPFTPHGNVCAPLDAKHTRQPSSRRATLTSHLFNECEPIPEFLDRVLRRSPVDQRNARQTDTLQVSGCRFQMAGCRLQVAGSRFQVSGCRLQVPDGRLQVASCRFQVPGFRLQVAGSRWQVAGCKLQVPGSRFQVAVCRLQVEGCRFQIAGCRLLQVEGCRLQAAGCRLQVSGFRLNDEVCKLKVPSRRLQAAGCWLQVSVASCRLQVAGCRLQVASLRLQVAGCRLQVAGCRLQVAGFKLQVSGVRWSCWCYLSSFHVFCVVVLSVRQQNHHWTLFSRVVRSLKNVWRVRGASKSVCANPVLDDSCINRTLGRDMELPSFKAQTPRHNFLKRIFPSIAVNVPGGHSIHQGRERCTSKFRNKVCRPTPRHN